MKKNSKQRDLIIHIIRNTKCHPNADWIYDQARLQIPNISLGTIYRNLNLLCTEGKIAELSLDKGITRYDGDLREHYHVRCSQCGRIDDVPHLVPRVSVEEIEQSTGYRIHTHQMSLIGLCPDCEQKNCSLGTQIV